MKYKYNSVLSFSTIKGVVQDEKKRLRINDDLWQITLSQFTDCKMLIFSLDIKYA